MTLTPFLRCIFIREAAMCSENGSDSLYLEEEWRLVA